MTEYKGISTGIKANADRRWEEFKQTDAWLQSAVSFKHDLYLTDDCQDAVNKVYNDLYGTAKKKHDKLQLTILLANLVQTKRRPIAISMNRNKWKKTRYAETTSKMIDHVNKLCAKGYIEKKSGFYDHLNPSRSRNTRIWATDKLLAHFPILENQVKSEPKELVELKDWDRNLIDYNDWDCKSIVKPIREVLEMANKVNGSADICYHRYKVQTSLVAIFKEDFSMYGRIHTRGFRHLQSYRGKERSEFTINGEEVVELDFKAYHPYLLYAEEGIQLNGDPYLAVDSRMELRPLLKQVFLSMLNGEASGKKSALRAANKALYDERKRWWKAQVKNPTIGEFPITDAKQLIEAFKSGHKPIAHHFCNGKRTGMKAMNKDSKIALDVLEHFVEQGIPILPIHDSFIVQEKYKKELRRTMESVYIKHTGGFTIPIRRITL